jgi:putative cell wall-binding protein
MDATRGEAMRMHTSRAGAAVLAAATAVAGLALFPAPVAAVPIAANVTANSAPTIFANTTGQSAGDWSAILTGGVSVGDTITIQVDDNDADANCAATNDGIGFNGTPIVTVNAPTTGAPAFAVLTAGSGGACATAGVSDQLVLTATTSSTADPITITISGVKYDVGSAAAAGPIRVGINGGGLSTAGANAVVSLVRATSNNPPVLLAKSTVDQSISNIVFTEAAAGQIPSGQVVCVHILGPAGVSFDSVAPTLQASGGGAAASVASAAGANVSFTVTTQSSGAPATFTLSNIKLDTGPNTGLVVAQVGTGADAPTACTANDITESLTLAAIGVVNRIGGGDRYATAQLLFQQLGQCNDDVVLARGDNFPDALAASYLAGQLGTGILLTEPNMLPSATTNAIRQAGVKNVYIVGGTQAISTAVENALKGTNQATCPGGGATATKLAVTRISGADRFATARSVAEFPGLNAGGTTEPGLDAVSGATCETPVKTAIVASGENFPDALAAGTVAAAGAQADGADDPCDVANGPLPLLLTAAGALSPATQQALVNLKIKQVILMGGNVAVSQATQTQIAAANGITVIRVGGANRQETARLLAERLANPFTFNYGESLAGDGDVFVARGDNFPDALAAGPLAGFNLAPMFLTDSPNALGPQASQGIAGLSRLSAAGIDTAMLVGGTAALSATVFGQVGAAIASQVAPT